MVKKDNIEALVIDLRWNPGGLLRSAVDVSDMFLPGSYPIEITVGEETRSQNLVMSQ